MKKSDEYDEPWFEPTPAPPVCKKECEHALAIGMPEYAGMQSKPNGCGNCEHYLSEPDPEPNVLQNWNWLEQATVEVNFKEPHAYMDTMPVKLADGATVKFFKFPTTWPEPEAKWEPEVENFPAPLDDPTVQAVRIEHLINGGGFGHAGTHHGNGTPGCPKAVHHHHDMFCPAPTQEEWERAGRDGEVPPAHHWMYSRM